jgi:hypothetical protein
MTIRRQYSLPNCTLVLEGLTDNSLALASGLDSRPLLNILVNAECYFVGQGRSLSGGRDFLESLVRSVNRYAQEFLSHVPHPQQHGDQPEILQLQHLPGQNLHRLTMHNSQSNTANLGMGQSNASQGSIAQGTWVQIDLTTVQLFDLVEAIDQFLADRQTLPDISISLQPLSKRFRKGEQPLVKRAAPAAVGMSSLAVAALAFFLLPVPQMREPKPAESQTTSSQTSSPSPTPQPQGSATPTPTGSPPSASDIETLLTTAPEITDPTELNTLQSKLYSKINDAWKNRTDVRENLEYRVGVGKDSAIVGYKEVDKTPIEARKETPLPDLLYIPASGGVANQESLAQFRVVFDKRGILQVSPWRGFTAKPSLGPEITDSSVVNTLNDKLYSQIRESWTGKPIYPRDLIYRVAVSEDGNVANFEAINQPASDYVQETPLKSLTKTEAAPVPQEKPTENATAVPQKPLAQFRVVFKTNGVLEVSPLRGSR